MDLHSYAKGVKKWSIEHTRKLVSARISYDNMFANHPILSMLPWRKFVHLTKLDDYNVMFVRNQWFELLDKYKKYKKLRLGKLSAKSSSMLDHDILLGQNLMPDEWEFFPSIHRFMTQKTTNLHSYALKEPNNQGESTTSRRTQKYMRQQHKQQQQFNNNIPVNSQDKQIEEDHHNQQQQEQINNILSSITTTALSPEHPTCITATLCSSSDTNDEFAAAMGLLNDHDFYSKKSSISTAEQQQESQIHWPSINCFGDGSDDTKESMDHHLIENSKLVTFEDDCAVEMQLPGFIREEITETTTTTNAVYNAAAAAAGINQTNHSKPIPNAVRNKRGNNNDTNGSPVSTTQQRKSRRIQNIKIVSKNQQQQQQQQQQKEQSIQQKEQSIHGPRHQQHGTSVLEPPKAIEERLAYYRHKRRFNHRQEKRFDALLSVLGQIVKVEYPNVDMTPLNTIIDTLSNISSDEELA